MLIRLVDYYIAVFFGLVDYCPDTAIYFSYKHLQVLIFFFGNVDGVRVYSLEHGIYACVFYSVDRQRIDIIFIELLHYCVLDLCPLESIESISKLKNLVALSVENF